MWLAKPTYSRGSIDLLLKDPGTKTLWEAVGAKNVEEWRTQIHKISWYIENDRWNIGRLTSPDNISGRKGLEHHTQFRDVVSVLRFLRWHGPFQKENLA